MPVAIDFLIAQRSILRKRSDEDAISWLARRQHGVASRGQLLALGFTSAWIGVYRLGHAPLTQEGRWLAAVLSLGDDAVLSHRCALAYLALGTWSGLPELTVPRRIPSRPGLIIHRAQLPSDEVMIRDGVPVTRPSRTLLDLASVLDERGLRRALNEAAYLRLPLCPSLPHLIERHPRRRGVAKLRAILVEGRIGLERIESDFEDEFGEWLRARGFPPAEHQHPVTVGEDRYRLDFAWRDRMVAVELDTPAGHDHPEAIERDKRRDRRLRAVGWTVLRITARAFALDPGEVEADLRAALGV